MPPAIFVDASTGEGVNAATSVDLEVPSSARPRDTMILIVSPAIADGLVDVDSLEADGWEELLVFAANTNYLYVFRRAIEDGDSRIVSAPLLVPITSTTPAALLVYRNLDNGADAVGASAANVNPSSVNFPCPSRTLTRYSDLYIGITLVESDDETTTPPAGGTERVDFQCGAEFVVPMSLYAFDLLAEATGATGTQTAVVAGAEIGMVASIALAADALIGFGKSFTVEPLGAIGLPSRGV